MKGDRVVSDTDKEVLQTTDEEFEIFQRSVRYWIEKFGLKGWRISFNQRSMGDKGYFAELDYHMMNRSCVFCFTLDYKKISEVEFDPDNLGFHEVSELLMSRLRVLSSERFISEDEITEEIHAIIRMLENTVYHPLPPVVEKD